MSWKLEAGLHALIQWKISSGEHFFVEPLLISVIQD
jgi:hypothetical protein